MIMTFSQLSYATAFYWRPATSAEVGLIWRPAGRGAASGPGGQQRCGLGDVSPGGGGADAEPPDGQLGKRVVLAQVGRHQQGLPGPVELAPARADLPAVTVNDPDGVVEGLAGQRQRGRLEKHRSPSAANADLGRALHLPGASPCPKMTRRT